MHHKERGCWEERNTDRGRCANTSRTWHSTFSVKSCAQPETDLRKWKNDENELCVSQSCELQRRWKGQQKPCIQTRQRHVRTIHRATLPQWLAFCTRPIRASTRTSFNHSDYHLCTNTAASHRALSRKHGCLLQKKKKKKFDNFPLMYRVGFENLWCILFVKDFKSWKTVKISFTLRHILHTFFCLCGLPVVFSACEWLSNVAL